MEFVKIYWENGVFVFSEIPEFPNDFLENNGFYVILAATYDATKNIFFDMELLYIGQTFDQTFRERIPQPHEAYPLIYEYMKYNSQKTVVAKLGAIYDCDAERITQELFDDIECCLINKNQPIFNDKCKKSYIGRSIIVENIGDYFPLKEGGVCF